MNWPGFRGEQATAKDGGVLLLERSEPSWRVKTFGILRFAQDDDAKQTTATAKTDNGNGVKQTTATA
jgi:hypothetical protein